MLRPSILNYWVKQKEKEILTQNVHSKHRGELALADVYFEVGLYIKAKKLQEGVWKTWKESLGDQHSDTLQAEAALWRTMNLLEERHADDNGAICLLDRLSEGLGEQHPVTLKFYSRINVRLICEASFKRTRAMQTKILGEHHPDTLRTCLRLGYKLAITHRVGEAEELLTSIIHTCVSRIGENHPLTLQGRIYLVFVYGLQCRFREARSVGTKVLQDLPHVHGEQHPESLKIKDGVNQYLEWENVVEGKVEAGLIYLLYGQRVHLGADHPEVRRTQALLELNCMEQENQMRRILAAVSTPINSQNEAMATNTQDMLQNSMRTWISRRGGEKQESLPWLIQSHAALINRVAIELKEEYDDEYNDT